MSRAEITYRIANKGLATSFTESEIPLDYAAVFKNRFINAAGGAEKRQGVDATSWTALGQTITNAHEYVGKDGATTVYLSGNGKIYRDDSGTWTLVHTMTLSTAKLLSVQFGDKLIFVNGVDRNIYTDDNGATFKELIALLEEGSINSVTTTSMSDSDITDWTATDVNLNDLAYNVSKDGYGLVTTVSAGSTLNHTSIGPGATGIGQTTVTASAGDEYQIIDLVELNIIPTDNVPDNVADAGTGTDTVTVAVSGVDFSSTDARIGDFISNTTRNAVTRIESIATALTVTSVASQTVGDSLIFLKSAMPITRQIHVHFNRLYHVDARDRRKARVSGANDAQDMTTDGGTLDPITFNYDLAASGDVLQAIGSYQRFLVLAGRRAIYVYQGTTPVGASADITPIGSFPLGIVSKFGLLDVGNDLLFLSDDGLQSVRIVVDANAVAQANIAEPIRTTLRELIQTTAEDDLQLIQYPRRSWAILKVGTQLFVYNYVTVLSDTDQEGVYGGSWSLFDGTLAQQNAYLVRSNGDLICGGSSGQPYDFDTGLYNDDGTAISTEYETPWLSLESPRKQTVRIKDTKYLKWLTEVGASITYSTTITGGFQGEGLGSGSFDAADAVAPIGVAVIGTDKIGGSKVANIKIPLRARGEVFKVNITTETTLGPDILGRYTLYFNTYGRR